jgi:cupin 2 domain-containing protein
VNPVPHGRLANRSGAPTTGERTVEVVRAEGLVVNQILSGTLERAVDYCQDHVELALVLEGRAVLDVAGERLELSAGAWVLLPAGTPHRLVSTTSGTNWLTVHLDRRP